MRLRIEIREGEPSMFNPAANLYVVAIHPEIGPRGKDGEPSGEKMLGGPMTERNAVDMVEAIRYGGLPDDAVREDPEDEHVIEEMDLPDPPPRPEPPEPRSDIWIPLSYLIAIALFVLVVVYWLGIR